MNRISSARVLVTGGAGFVGSTIVQQLLEAGAAEVRILDKFVRGSRSNLPRVGRQDAIAVIEGDIRDARTVDEACRGVDLVFHEAALRITHCAEVPRAAVEVLIDGTLNVLEAAVRHGVSKVIAASSASVYGEPCYLPIDESHPFNNRTMYGAGKIAAEQMLRAYFTMYGLPYVAFRYFNVYGPRMDITSNHREVMIRWLDAIDANQRPVIFGDGEQTMDFVFVTDVARANLLAAQSDITDEVFNIGTGAETTLNDLCEKLLRITGSSLKPEYREARKIGNIQMNRAAIRKAKTMLGFTAEVSLDDGLRQLIDWRQGAQTAMASMEAF
jgi:UDP-glucose 4-epimerase